MQASIMESMIFVTHVEPMGPFLKICGQTSRSTMEEVESALRRMHVLLLTHRLQPVLTEINSSDIYLVQANAEALFRRCNVLNAKHTGQVKVFLIDYGIELEVHVSQMQLVMDSLDGSTLLSIPPQVQYGILAGVYIKQSLPHLQAIQTQLCDVAYTFRAEDQINAINVITLITPAGHKVSDSLILQSLAYPIAAHDQLHELRQYQATMLSGGGGSGGGGDKPHAHFANDGHVASVKAPPTSRGLVPSRPLSAATQYTIAGQQQPHLQRSVSVGVSAVQQQPPPKHHQSPATTRGLVAARPLKLITTLGSSGQLEQQHPYTTSSASTARNSVLPPRNLNYRPSIAIGAPALPNQPLNGNHSTGITPSPATTPASAPAATAEHHTGCHMPTFSSNTLLVKSQHTVTVAYVEDGPSLFSIHLKAKEHDLDQMMSSLGNYPLQNLHTKPALGMACVARYTVDSNLYRAVIMNIRPTTCLVAFVDYGITGDVPFSQLYQIPAIFLRHQIFAMRFTLAGYQQLLPLSRELDQLFRDLVLDAELQLVVRPLDGPPCVQYCELYAHGGQVNVFERLLGMHRAHRHYTPATALRDNELVIIRCIENAKHFYVQTVRNLEAYEQMIGELQMFGRQSASADLAPMRVGEPCMVWHKENKEWNRAEVVEVLADDERTASAPLPDCIVQYVDMGSVDEARPDELRLLDSRFLVLPRQTVECCLESFADVPNVSKSTLEQMEMLADREDGHPRTFKVNIYATLADPGRQALVVNLIDTSVQPILDLSQRVFMMCMPQREFRAYEQQRYQRLTAAAAGGAGQQRARAGETGAPPKFTNGVLNSTQLETPDQSPDSTHSTEETRYGGDGGQNNNTQSSWEAHSQKQLQRSSSSPISAGRTNWRTGGGRQQQQQQQVDEQPLQRRSIEKVVTKTTQAAPIAAVEVPADDRQATKQQQKRDKKAYGGGSNRHLIPRFNKQNRKEPVTIAVTDDDNDSSGHFSQSTGSATSATSDTPITIAPPAVINLDNPAPIPSVISYWKSPIEFYVQPRETQDEFLAMMKQVQNDYRNRASDDALLVDATAGTFVVGRRPEGFYRAQLVPALSDNQGHSSGLDIHYIDNGDRVALQPDTVWPMDRCFGQYARFAVRCCLADVAQLADNHQIARQVQAFAEPGKVVQTMLRSKLPASDAVESDTYLVDVMAGEESLKQVLIRDGLLVPVPDGVNLSCLVGQTIVIDIRKFHQQRRMTGSIFGCKSDQVLVFEYSQPIADGIKSVTAHVDGLNNENVLAITPLTAPPAGLLSAPLLSFHFTVQIVQVDSANVLHLQNVAHAKDGDRLINDMFDAYDTQAETDRTILSGALRTRQLCAGRSLADGNWYRCIVERVPTAADPLVTVRYIDYGNCEQLPRDHLRQLLDKYHRPDTLAMRCYLALRGIDEEATAIRVASLTDGLALELTVLALHAGHCIVDISSRGRSLVNVLGDSGLAVAVDLQTVRAQIDEDVRNMQTIELELLPEPPVQVPATVETPAAQIATPATVVAPAPAVVAATAVEPIVPVPVCNIYENRIECYLSHTDRPDRFYLRRLADEPALEQMQENIQIVAASLPALDDYSNGTQCIVKYSGDDLWYRAAIIDSGSGITSVLFIDYGNTDTITQPGLIKAMDEAFRSIQPYAIACMLPIAVNAADGGGGGAAVRTEWPEEACQLMRGLLDERLAFEYLTTGASCSVVSLWAPPDRDVSLELIRAGFARPVPFIPNGQPAFVSHVNSLEDFYIQMEGETNSLEIVADYLQNPEQFAKLQTFEANTICTAQYSEDGGWYRARILRQPSAADADAVDVVFIDYGNTSTVTELRALPANIALLPHLSKQCALQRPAGVAMWSDEAERKFQEIASDGATVFAVQLVMPSSRASTVQLAYGEAAVDLSTELAALCDKFDPADVDVLNASMMSSCSMGATTAAAAGTQAGTVFRVNSAQDFMVRLDVHRVQLEAIDARMVAESAQWPTVRVLQTGDLCAARSPLDGHYHRAVISEISSDGQHLCHLFDEGMHVRSDDLRVLPADLAEHSQCFEHCQIKELPATELAASEGPVIRAGDQCHVQLVDATVQPHLVALFADALGERQCFQLLPTPDAEKAETVAESVAGPPPVEPSVVAPASVASVVGYLTAIDSSGAFWMQPESVTDQLNAIGERMAALQEAERKTTAARVGELCAAKYDEDELFYRAKILGVESDVYQVSFIDYGNTATTSHLCELPADLAVIPALATHCALAASSSPDDGALEEAEFLELMSASDTPFHFELGESGTDAAAPVRMFRDAERTQEIRVKTAVSAVADEPPRFPVNSDFSASICWSNSSQDFYVQPADCGDIQAKLSERLASAPAIGHLVSPTVGQLCAAKFEDDGLFYRARILSVDSDKNEYNALFVDYGNEAIVTDIRVLPDELLPLRLCAVPCTLQRPATTGTATINEHGFMEMLGRSAGPFYFHVCAVDQADNGRLLVRMWTNEQRTDEVLVPVEQTVV